LPPLLDDVNRYKKQTRYSFGEHTTKKVSKRWILLKPQIVQSSGFKELVAAEVQSCCRDRAQNIDGKTLVKASDAFGF
jgi:hypothetical protein